MLFEKQTIMKKQIIMKKQTIMKIFGLILVSIMFASCINEEQNRIDEQNKSFMEKFSKSEVGYSDSEKIIFNPSNEQILTSFKSYAKKNSLEIEPLTFKVEKIDNKDYLRFYNKDNSVSTIALIVNESGKVMLGGTVCTSVDCASGGGCVPSGDYCTKCVTGTILGQTQYGDCKRSTSN
jgi:hypothetical protein